MRYYSTRNNSDPVTFAAAALTGLAPDGGLYIPEEIPRYRDSVRKNLGAMDFLEIAFETILPYVKDEIPPQVLEDLVTGAFPFGCPLVPFGFNGKPADSVTSGNRASGRSFPLVLELFHGPTAAFKDFGARFMARCFSWLRRGESRPLCILVATSGDTGGAVADGFFGVEGIDVTVLYPKGRVSELQEKQIAGLGDNISALAVEGSFDDCQRLVKSAFADKELKESRSLSSANSINISRLIPQALYYAAAAGRAGAGKTDPGLGATPWRSGGRNGGNVVPGLPLTMTVPSGNFGNLTAGLYAMAMGAPIAGFIAATNINKTVPDYLESGEYKTRPSRATISNAMDVGAPSNFERMAAHWSYTEMKKTIRGFSVTDDETRTTIGDVFNNCGYYLDPHGAVGWTAADKATAAGILTGTTVVLATAHPAKFSETVEPITGPVPVPESIQKAMARTAWAKTIPAELSALKEFLLHD
ncbi:MAG: threonine synthase [Treponema sp.]|jgi:threonine synthase|nr:threonine synthase [Treponema sp.]